MNNKLKRIILLYVVCIFVLSLLFHPIGARLFPWRRAQLLEHFIQLNSQTPNARAYWQLRESLSPGFNTYNNQASTVRQILYIHHMAEGPVELTRFHSPHITSVDYLIPQNQASEMDPVEITQKDAHTYTLRLLFPLEDLYHTHGLYDFEAEEKQLLTGRLWLAETTITL